MKTYTVFILVGYQTIDPANQFHQDIYQDSVSVELEDTSVESAMKRAKALITKNNWFVKSIIEKHYGNS